MGWNSVCRDARDHHTQIEIRLNTDENAVNLVYGLVGLQNNYDVDGFETKRQGALVALIACCPRKAAPYVYLSRNQPIE